MCWMYDMGLIYVCMVCTLYPHLRPSLFHSLIFLAYLRLLSQAINIYISEPVPFLFDNNAMTGVCDSDVGDECVIYVYLGYVYR